MPMHNASRYVEDSVRSVISQTFQDWELLVVDDASTDDSRTIVQQYAQQDSRVKLLRNAHPSGNPASPRNVGVEAAQGRYIAFLDSDDVWLPNKLERQLPLFERDDTVIVYSDYEKMTDSGKRSNRVVHAPREVGYRQLLKGNVIGNLTGIYDTGKVGKHYFQVIHHEDYPMWLAILKTSGKKARNVGEVLAVYRVREQSVSARKLSILFWQWDIYRKIEHFGIARSAYLYANYAVRAFYKSLI